MRHKKTTQQDMSLWWSVLSENGECKTPQTHINCNNVRNTKCMCGHFTKLLMTVYKMFMFFILWHIILRKQMKMYFTDIVYLTYKMWVNSVCWFTNSSERTLFALDTNQGQKLSRLIEHQNTKWWARKRNSIFCSDSCILDQGEICLF